jgi:ring-1,2-phenylacetyl-CoA epoxidase subunit PaaB
MADRVWEVFQQAAEGDPMIHGGSVRAPDEELALHYAREFYGRRQESHRLWVVPRDAITELDDPDLLQPPFDRSFKRPGGYLIKHKLEAARQRAGGPEGDGAEASKPSPETAEAETSEAKTADAEASEAEL